MCVGTAQVLGYGLRLWCHNHTESIAAYTVHNCFIGLAPVFYAASIYMVLGRLIRKVHGEQWSPIRPAWITRTFVTGDCLALTLQASGIAMTPWESTQKAGGALVVAGLFVQLAMFGSFVFIAAIFHRRYQKVSDNAVGHEVPWKQGLRMLYACSALILVRSLFRVVEYLMGTDGYLLSHEWPVFVFDAPLMLIAQIIFVWWYPDAFHVEQREEGGKGSSDSSDLEK